MIISKKEKLTIYKQLFRFGILVIKKYKKYSSEKKEIGNLVIIKLLKGLLSKGLVKETFSWGVFYFTLNQKGVEYLRSILGLPSNVIPLVYRK